MRTTTALLSCVFVLASVLVDAGEGADQTNANELAAWESAAKDGTPTAFANYFKKYPASPRIKTQTGAVIRGRFWWKTDAPSDPPPHGVIVTVKGTDLFVNVSVEEAKRLKVVNSKPIRPGTKNEVKGKTFNYVYGEIVEGGFAIGKEVIEPRDNVDSTIVLSADGSRLLTWDLSNAKESTHPDRNPTFPAAAARMKPFNDIPEGGLDKNLTPASQEFSVEQNLK